MFLSKMRSGALVTIIFIIAIIFSFSKHILAWQVSVPYSHNNRFGGEAESGWHRGNVEFSGSQRWIRAGDDYVFWTQQQVSWWITHGDSHNRPAMVYHAFKLDSNECGDIRITNSRQILVMVKLAKLGYVDKTCRLLVG